MLLKRSTIVRLESNEEPILITKDGKEMLTFPRGSLVFNSEVFPSLKLLKNDEVINNKEHGYKRSHLYLTIVEEFNEGDVIMEDVPHVLSSESKAIGELGLKVIASTDKTLELPRFSKGLLERYVDKQGIFDVFAVFEEFTDTETGEQVIVPKTNKHNVISLRKVKTEFSSAEVITLLITFAKEFGIESSVNKWINNHV